MVKCLESLVTLYRTLITVCGLLIVVGTNYHPAISGRPTPAEMNALQDKLDFFGYKLSAAGICNIGSIVVITLLLMMINLTRTAKQLPPPKEPGDAGFWFGQFLGPLAPLSAVTLVLLPFAAVGQAQSTLSWMLPDQTQTGFFDPSERVFDVLVLSQLAVSVWLWIESYRAARQWRTRMKSAGEAAAANLPQPPLSPFLPCIDQYPSGVRIIHPSNVTITSR